MVFAGHCVLGGFAGIHNHNHDPNCSHNPRLFYPRRCVQPLRWVWCAQDNQIDLLVDMDPVTMKLFKHWLGRHCNVAVMARLVEAIQDRVCEHLEDDPVHWDERGIPVNSLHGMDPVIRGCTALQVLSEACRQWHTTDRPLLPRSAFWTEEVCGNLDVNDELFRYWRVGADADGFSFLRDAPCVLTTPIKSKILSELHKDDQNRAVETSIINSALNMLYGVGFQPFFILTVRRQAIVEDSLATLSRLRTDNQLSQLRKPLRVVFQDEPGEDFGGVRREYFQMVLKEVFQQDYGSLCPVEQCFLYAPRNRFRAGGDGDTLFLPTLCPSPGLISPLPIPPFPPAAWAQRHVRVRRGIAHVVVFKDGAP